MLLIKERVGRLINSLHGLIYTDMTQLPDFKIYKSEERLMLEDILKLSFSDFDNSCFQCRPREHYYLKTEFVVPKELSGKALTFEMNTGRGGGWGRWNPQMLVFINGKTRQGLDENHHDVLVTNCAREGERLEIIISFYTCDDHFDLAFKGVMKVLHKDVEKYFYDLKVPYEVLDTLSKDSDDYYTILNALNESLNLLDLRVENTDSFYLSLKTAQDYLTKNFYESKCRVEDKLVYCVGHTHIDVAWLWTLETTRDKAVRSFTTVLELMDRFPDYKFMSSQPQLYKFVKKYAPDVYERIKEKIKEGRWETEGGMFLEADCNLTSGESLVRQFLYGTSFFKKEFGTTNEILWLPDVFGYSAALPQIMQKCGIKYFMTTKISWNEINKMPYDTFKWTGIDGTQVLTHFAPARDYCFDAMSGKIEPDRYTTYNAMLNPSQVKGGWQRYNQKYLNNEVLISFGYGDGGGGPTPWMLENELRTRKGIPGLPATKMSTSREFFKQLETEVEGNKYLPEWVGELYLEYHRGTYTSMARNKKYNRKSEFAYENLEFYSTLAKYLLGEEYPQDILDEGWEVILRNQFHDILPGSSIKEVYEESREEYEKILSVSNELKEKLLEKITNEISADKGTVTIFNPNSTCEKAVVEIKGIKLEPHKAYFLEKGDLSFELQQTEGDKALTVCDGIPAKGFTTFTVVEKEKATVKDFYINENIIETPFFKVRLNDKGQFESIFDKKAGREIVKSNQCANVIVSYEDRPHNWENWDINNYYTEKSWELSEVSKTEVVENGPVRICLLIERKYLSSTIKQYLYFYKDRYAIDIVNEIDWKEKQLLLKDYFPVDVHTNEATYEIQYGNVKRPTHRNTSWDYAKFEVCHHKWMDVSEEGYGVSFLNDCKYGCDVKGSTVGLTMLKAGTYPNPDADKEKHLFTYSICPHDGDFRQGNTVQKAYLLNNPYEAKVKNTEGGKLPCELSFIKTRNDNIVIEVVKKQQEGQDTIIRLYECHNKRTKVELDTFMKLSLVQECNMLEQEIGIIESNDNFVSFEMKPYEIKTLKLNFK